MDSLRTISDIEKYLLVKAINNSVMKSEERYYWINKVDDLKVIEECPCDDPSCNSVKFKGYERGKSIGLVTNLFENDRIIVVKIHKDTDEIIALDVTHDENYKENTKEMDELYEQVLEQWGKKKVEIRKWRALYESRNDYDYLSYAHKAEDELRRIEEVLEPLERNL